MASQQPPTRSWFRLASVSRPTRAPTTASAPPRAQALPVAQPRPSIIRPTSTRSSSNTPTQQAQPSLAPPTQAPTPRPVAASPPVPASKSPPPQAAAAPPATAFPWKATNPPLRATAPPPAPPQKSQPQRAAATPPSLVPAAPPKSPTATTFPNAISLEPRVIREELKSKVSPPPAPKAASPPLAPASQLVTVIGATNEPIIKPLSKPDPSPSPKTKHLTSPPSALTLPPPLLKSRMEHHELKPKTVLVQETIENPKVMPSIGKTHSTDISRLSEKPDVRKDNGNYKKLSDSEEFGRTVITVAGENKGAIMECTPFITKNGALSPHKNGGNPRTGTFGEKYRSDSGSSNEEGRGKSKYKSYKVMTNSSPPMSAFMNSNVQGVNNSILYNCSDRDHDPGVLFSLHRKANDYGKGIKPNNEDHASGIW